MLVNPVPCWEAQPPGAARAASHAARRRGGGGGGGGARARPGNTRGAPRLRGTGHTRPDAGSHRCQSEAVRRSGNPDGRERAAGPHAPTNDGVVGQFCVQKVANSAGKQLLQFMRHNQLTAANTLFRPRRHRRCRRNRYAHPGNVTYRPRGGKNGCDAQIDYVLVSQRWKSSVETCYVRWGPSLQLQAGNREDHGAVMMRWKQRVRCPQKSPPKPDLKALKDIDILLRCENAGRQELGKEPLTKLQLERKVAKPAIGLWSEQQQSFSAAVEAYGAVEYEREAAPLARPTVLRAWRLAGGWPAGRPWLLQKLAKVPQWVAQPDFGRQIGIVAACWLPVLDLRRRLAASQKSDLTQDAGLNQSLE
jgi:hypothetical protein